MNKDSIRLEGMEFYGFHGVMPEENRLGQRFIIDVIMKADLESAGCSDSLEDTINYAAVYEAVKQIAEGEPVKLLETLARRIISKIFSEFSLVQSIRVKVHKPGAPIQGVFRDVCVSMGRDRE